MDIKRRSIEVPRVLIKRLGYIHYVMFARCQPAISERIQTAFRALYRPQDVASGGHIGVFMYRDIFARIAIPHIVGSVALNPFQFVELTPLQCAVIQKEPEELAAFIDQFTDDRTGAR